MGRLDVPVRVAHPSEHARAEEVRLMVDTGATFTVLPLEVWERLGLTGETTRRLRTADGRVLERPQGLAYLEVDGQLGTATSPSSASPASKSSALPSTRSKASYGRPSTYTC